MFKCDLFVESSPDITNVEGKCLTNREELSLLTESDEQIDFSSETEDIDTANETEKKWNYNENDSKEKNTKINSTKFVKSIINELNNINLTSKETFFFLPQTNEKIKNSIKKEQRKKIKKLPDINIDTTKYVDITCFGFWIVSSFKNKFGLNNLKDDNPCTFWQTTSLGPHTLTIQFSKLMKISKIFLLFNYLLDESYTPYEIAINIGNDENHLEHLGKTHCTINNYSTTDYFWFVVDMAKINTSLYMNNFQKLYLKKKSYVYARCLQIVILSNQHNGRDTRIRQVKLFGPGYITCKNKQIKT